MKGIKIVAGLIMVAVGAALLVGLLVLFQRLLISGTDALNDIGSLLLDEGDIQAPDETPAPDLDEIFSASSFDGDPADSSAPEEELVSIPVEQTAEELAEEEKQKAAGQNP